MKPGSPPHFPARRLCLAALESLMGRGPWLAGAQMTLADLHAAPIFAYGMMAPEGRALVARHGAIREWWEMMARRPSMEATRFALEQSAQ